MSPFVVNGGSCNALFTASFAERFVDCSVDSRDGRASVGSIRSRTAVMFRSEERRPWQIRRRSI